MVNRVRTALFLDFDNVFGGLYKIDPEAAIEFAESPGTWLSALEDSLTVTGPRRWLVLRCYMNPAGWLPTTTDTGRLYFSRFRPSFTQAGFEVIDCPRLTYTKNAADIRLVLDAVDASMVVPAYEEFVIASGDSDMTPLLVRLRAADRRTTIFSPSDAAEAFTAVADRLIGADQVLALIQGEPPEIEDDLAAATLIGEWADSLADEPDPGPERSPSLQRARAFVIDQYEQADGPLNLARLSSSIRQELAGTAATGIIQETRWFGARSFGSFLRALKLPNMQLSQHYVWDGSRHTAPTDGTAARAEVPSAVARVTATLSLPRVSQDTWGAIYQALAEYAATHEFRLAEATRWGRDRLADQDIEVSRHAVGVVTRATAFGGAPLHSEPPPTADQIGSAFVRNLLDRAVAAELTLSDEESVVVQNWFGSSAAEG
jgi:uncharacterized LabA/DUF88 family protein